MRFDLVIFDCDGVLVDSETIANEVLAAILNRHGAALSVDDTKQAFIGQSVYAIRQTALSAFGIALAEDWATEYYAELLPALREVKAIPGVRAVVEAMHENCVPICVASQGPPQKMQITLGAIGLAPFFGERVYSANSVPRPKPAPDLFLHVAAACAADPTRCVVVEDSKTGVTAAVAAGMTVFAYCPPTEAGAMTELGAHPFHGMGDLVPHLLS